MEIRDRHRLERHARRIEELRLRRNARECRIEDWTFRIGDGEPQKLRLGDFWPEIGTPVRLGAEARVPKDGPVSPSSSGSAARASSASRTA